jgi:aminoglycoside phosphotransferase (APT) family kinase protein
MNDTSAPWSRSDGTLALTDWLDANLPELGTGPITLTPLTGGTSGSVLRLERDGNIAVLRTSAWPPRDDSSRALQREARLLKALGQTEVPHPRFLGFSEDANVIGSPFCIFEFIEGWVGSATPPEPFALDLALRHQTAYAMVDGLAKLADVDPEQVGLADFGKPERFLERQADRWLGLMAQHQTHPKYGDRKLPGLEEVADWLRTKTPTMQKVTLVHGDVSYSNIMFCNEAPPRLAAIIDWEIATIGDPLLDLGRALFPFPARDGSPGYSLAIDHTGYPPREDLAEYYAQQTGLSIAAIDYYVVLSMFKLAALIEFNHVKSLSEPEGSMSHRLAAFTPQLIEGALMLARKSDL